MEESIEKFKNYLEDCLKTIQLKKDKKIKAYSIKQNDFSLKTKTYNDPNYDEESLMDYQKDIKDLITFLTRSEEKQQKCNWLYLGFPTVSVLLENSNLTAKEQMDVIFYILKRNISGTSMQNLEGVKSIYKNGHRNIKQHYFDKWQNYSLKDIIFIQVSLKGLGVSPKLCTTIERLLTKELEKRVKKTCFQSNPKEENEKTDFYKTNKEKNRIYRKIREFYNVDEEQAKRALNLKEIIYVLSLFYKVELPEAKIRKYFKDICHMSFPLNHPMVDFIALEQQAQNYDNIEIQQAIETIWEYWEQMVIASPRDYRFGNDILKKEMQSILNNLYQEANKLR